MKKPMKAFTAAVFIISLLILALVYHNELNPKTAGGFYCWAASSERKNCIDYQNREHSINQNMFFYGNNPDEKESYVKGFAAREERKEENEKE